MWWFWYLLSGLALRVASVHVDDKTVAGVLAVILQDAFHVEVLVELPVRVAVAHQEELGAPGFGEFGARKVDELAAESLALPLGHNDDQVELALGILVARGGKAIGRAFSRLSPKSEPSSLASAVFAISVAWANISS